MDLNSSNKNNPAKLPSAYDAFLKDKIDLKLSKYYKRINIRQNDWKTTLL